MPLSKANQRKHKMERHSLTLFFYAENHVPKWHKDVRKCPKNCFKIKTRR